MLQKLIAAASLGAGVLAVAAGAATPLGDVVVIRAGTIYLVDGETITGGGAIVVEDGKIVAVGPASSIEVPGHARTIDYGSGAVIAPGLVAVDSDYTSRTAGPRTADPTLLALDQFDPYAPLVSALKSGVTTVYLAPARGRLIAGQGAVVKSAGGGAGDSTTRVLRASSGLHGSISAEARRTPGYWEPPVPATVDVGLGVPRAQLPKTTMGAVLAIDELMAFAGGDDSLAEEYGPQTGPALAQALEDKLVWRMGAESAAEVNALLDVHKRYGMPLVIDGASRAASAAGAIAAAKVPVIARAYYNNGGNFGKGETANWPSYGHIARLVGEGVEVAIDSPGNLGAPDLRFGAALAMRGGLSADHALRGITLNAARVLGVADRVGSITVGKDADLVVMTGDPLSIASSVLATIIDGEVAWTPAMASSKRAKEARRSGAGSVVISVDELHVGNGVVLSPGEILLRDGKIAEVASRVGRPAGATLVRGTAAMPGMIDAYGHLGTEGGNRAFSTRFDLSRILEPGDYADREVAKRGVTTVNLISRSLGGVTPSIAYKPASTEFDQLVVADVATVVMKWDSSIIAQSGASVTQMLAKAKQYTEKWAKYEVDIAAWTPPEDETKAKSDDDEDEDADEEGNGDDEKKKKKKKKKERDPAKSVTGVFEGAVVAAENGPKGTMRFRFLEDEDGSITGSIRSSLYEDLYSISGSRTDYDVSLTVDTPDGELTITLAQVYSNDPPPKKSKKKSKEKSKDKKDDEKNGKDDDKKDDDKKKDDKKKDDKKDDKKKEENGDEPVKTFLRGEAKLSDVVVATIDVTQVSTEFKTAARTTRIVDEVKAPKAPKGKPKKPSIDPDLEPIRRAMAGGTSIVVTVARDDQILRCVDTFEKYGIKPVLFIASDAHEVADRIAGRVRGVLISRNRMTTTEEDGTVRNRLVELSAAGIPVAFFSQAEEGAAELGVIAAMAVARGLSPSVALRSLTADAAAILSIDDRVGTLEVGKDGDVIVLTGSPLEVSSSIERVFVNGREVR